MAEADLLVDVLVGQIDAAGKGGMSVDDHHFPVVPVILIAGEGRHHRRILPGGNALGAEHLHISVGKRL